MAKTSVKTYLLDTNVLVRFLVRDQEEHFREASAWFRSAQNGKIKLVVPTVVIAEACFVLESFYKRGRASIARSMMVFVSQRWLSVPERDIVLGLWEDYERGLHFVDSYLRTWARLEDLSVLSFDKKLNKKS